MTTNYFTTAKGASVRFFTDCEVISAETVIRCEIVGVFDFIVSRFENAHPMDKVWGFNEANSSICLEMKGDISQLKNWLNEKKEACRVRDFATIESQKNASAGKGERSENLVHGKQNW